MSCYMPFDSIFDGDYESGINFEEIQAGRINIVKHEPNLVKSMKLPFCEYTAIFSCK